MLQIHRKDQSAPAFIPDFTNPLGLLVHCHGKIETQLRSLEQAVRLLQGGDPAAVSPALRAVEAAQAHFNGPGVRHTEDEEESLFPRLRRFAGPSENEALGALDRLEAEHRTAEQAHAHFDAVLAASDLDVDELERCVAALVALYEPHMRLENEVIFPAAARALPPDEIRALGLEMRARRRM